MDTRPTTANRLTTASVAVLALVAGTIVMSGTERPASSQRPDATDARATAALPPLVLHWEEADWGPPSDREGFPAGLRNAPIATDPVTGGPTYLARFPAGSQFELHWHTYTETVTVLQGAVDITLDGTRYTATTGSYVVIPGGVHHAWHVPETADVVLLARRDGPTDFFFVEP